MPRNQPKEGDIFEIKLENAECSFGQVLSVEPDALNSIGVAIWEPTTHRYGDVLKTHPVSVLLITPDLLKNGTWPIIGNMPTLIDVKQRPYEKYRSAEWVGAKVIGSGIVVQFMRACAGLRPWNAWANPNYLDALLSPGLARPARAVMEGND